MTPEGIKIKQSSEITLTWGSWKKYILLFMPEIGLVQLYEGSDETFTKVGEIEVTDTIISEGEWIPIFFNEGSSTVVSSYEIGQFFVHELLLSNYKSTITAIDVTSITNGGYADSSALVLPKDCAITVSVTYGASVTAGVRVYVLASNDGTNFDTEDINYAFTYFDVGYGANSTKQKSVNLDCLPKYVKIRVRNLDGTNATGAVKVYVHRAY
jgi:hypothetical protein